jgi:hypothetical protein
MREEAGKRLSMQYAHLDAELARTLRDLERMVKVYEKYGRIEEARELRATIRELRGEDEQRRSA